MMNTWEEFFENEKQKEYYNTLLEKVKADELEYTIYPREEDRLNAFKMTPLNHVKVVILGQDPYINEGEAMGLSFSVPKGKKIPPSLRNIFKEIEATTGCDKKEHGDLTYLAEQGVFLLNCTLTVREKSSNSHKNFGYKTLSNNIISLLNEVDRPIVFILWGNFAREKAVLLNNPKHLVLEAVHPSPLGQNGKYKFAGCNHFVLTNEFLEKNGVEAINW